MNYPDSVEYLYSLGNEVKSIKFGLASITAVLRALGDPQRRFRAVHVAGTNGKGSTCAMVESGLRAAGLRTGRYISPHLTEPTERIAISGENVSREAFTRAFNAVHEAAEEMVRSGELEFHPTYFETVTAMAFLLFADTGVDVAVLEVGLGGRLDATNVVQPVVCAITPVDYDHQQWLGTTLESIAAEKAGILKAGVPVVMSDQRSEAEQVLLGRAEELGCPVTRSADLPIEQLEVDHRGSRFTVDDIRVRCPLPGEHQVENAKAAVAILRLMEVPLEAIARGIAATDWPARLELVHASPDIMLDGAHNPAGARALAAHIRKFYAGRRVWMVYGAMRDKAVAEMTEILFPLAEKIVLTTPSNTRSVPAETFGVPNARIAPTVREAVEVALAAPDDAVVFITGSLYLAGDARALLLGRDGAARLRPASRHV